MNDVHAAFRHLDLEKEDDRQKLLKHVQVIKPLRVAYTKPVAIIYNPNSGRRRNIKGLIIQKLTAAKIPYEILESRK